MGKKFKCEECEAEFKRPLIDLLFLEDYFGVNSLFKNRTKSKIELCPNCYSENIKYICMTGSCEDVSNKSFLSKQKEFNETGELYHQNYGEINERK